MLSTRYYSPNAANIERIRYSSLKDYRVNPTSRVQRDVRINRIEEQLLHSSRLHV